MKKDINNDENNVTSFISRREFLTGISKASAVFPLIQSLSLLGGKVNAKENISKSRIVIIRKENATSDYKINREVVQRMFDEGLMTLTGKNSTNESWGVILPKINLSKDRISLKVNCISNHVVSHKEVSFAITNSLVKFGVPDNNIIIWDRFEREIERAGYVINTSDKGVRCFGTDHPGIGYSEKLFKIPEGIETSLSRIMTDYTDYLINVPLLKNHVDAGITICLKNHFGSFKSHNRFHNVDLNNVIPQINAVPEIKDKCVLNVVDALFGVAYGGPGGPPTFTYSGLILGFDPVAIDYQGMKILESYKCPTIDIAKYVIPASTKYKLGNYDPKMIEIIEV